MNPLRALAALAVAGVVVITGAVVASAAEPPVAAVTPQVPAEENEAPEDLSEQDIVTTSSVLSAAGPSMADLPFGGNFAAVDAWLLARLDAYYDKALRNIDDIKNRPKLRGRYHREAMRLRVQVEALAGLSTRFDDTFLAGEFKRNAGEHVRLYEEGGRMSYFFFTQGHLWKVVRELGPEEPFCDRVKVLLGRLGEPALLLPDVKAWQDRTHRLEMRNLRERYGHDVMVITYRPLADRIEENRALSRPVEERPVDPGIREFLVDDAPEEDDVP